MTPIPSWNGSPSVFPSDQMVAMKDDHSNSDSKPKQTCPKSVTTLQEARSLDLYPNIEEKRHGSMGMLLDEEQPQRGLIGQILYHLVHSFLHCHVSTIFHDHRFKFQILPKTTGEKERLKLLHKRSILLIRKGSRVVLTLHAHGMEDML